jgi:hypothetical protein
MPTPRHARLLRSLRVPPPLPSVASRHGRGTSWRDMGLGSNRERNESAVLLQGFAGCFTSPSVTSFVTLRTERAVERTAPFGLHRLHIGLGLVHHGQFSRAAKQPVRPWYSHKAGVLSAICFATLRRDSWSERLLIRPQPPPTSANLSVLWSTTLPVLRSAPPPEPAERAIWRRPPPAARSARTDGVEAALSSPPFKFRPIRD